jgi:hypothetical protein
LQRQDEGYDVEEDDEMSDSDEDKDDEEDDLWEETEKEIKMVNAYRETHLEQRPFRGKI